MKTIILLILLLVLIGCKSYKLTVKSTTTEIATVKKSHSIHTIKSWYYRIELTDGRVVSETYHNPTGDIDNSALDKVMEAIHRNAKHDSLIKRRIIKPIY